MSHFPILSAIIFVPWLGALVLASLRGLRPATARGVALAFSLSTLLLSVPLAAGFNRSAAGMRFEEYGQWMETPSVHYHVGIDGLSLVLVLLTAVVSPVCLLAARKLQRDPRVFGSLYLLLQGSALGVFLTLDFFPWFLFWEFGLIPAYFLIKLWGGPGAGRAAFQFIVYTLAGSALLLVGFVALYSVARTFDFVQLGRLAAIEGLTARMSPALATVAFIGVFAGLAVKAPLFPFHTWMPVTYAEAPTGVTMFLTGVFSKMGVYGFIRLLWGFFPAQFEAASGYLICLALGSILVGAFAALAQRNLRRMLAYSSLSHIGFCLLALFAVAAAGRPASNAAAVAAALDGAILQIFNHGISAAAFFACAGILTDRRPGNDGLDGFGGLQGQAPRFALLCGITLFATLGLPGLGGFVGEFFIVRGVFGLAPWAATIAAASLIITALYLLTFWLKVFQGPLRGAAFRDLNGIEYATLVPPVVLMVLLGVGPQLLLHFVNPLVARWAGLAPP